MNIVCDTDKPIISPDTFIFVNMKKNITHATKRVQMISNERPNTDDADNDMNVHADCVS